MIKEKTDALYTPAFEMLVKTTSALENIRLDGFGGSNIDELVDLGLSVIRDLSVAAYMGLSVKQSVAADYAAFEGRYIELLYGEVQ